MYNNADKKHKSLAILLDLSKAFDKVNHKILLRKLFSCGIRGNIHNWISSFIANRKICTSVNGIISKSIVITDGVPQGAILSPLLYNIFINDFSNYMKIPSIIYADDTIVLLSANDIFSLQNQLTYYFQKLLHYYTSNKLLLNTDKTQLILFGDANIYNWNICNDTYLQNLPSVKYLGIHIDNQISINSHVTHLVRSLNKYITVFKTFRNLMTNNIKTLLVKSLIIPHIMYACPFLHTIHKKNINTLHVSYIRIIKILFHLPIRSHTDNVLHLCKLPSVSTLLHNSLHTLAHSIIKHSLPSPTLKTIYKPFPNNRNIQNIYNHRICLYHTKHPTKNFIFCSFIKFNEKISQSFNISP